MARYVLLFQSNTLKGRDADYTAWNEKEGMPGMLGIYGFTSAERFVLNEGGEGASEYPYRYMDAYDVETDDIDNVVRQAAAKSGALTDAGTLITVFKPLGPRLRALKQPVKAA
jgi:hypothetical protein